MNEVLVFGLVSGVTIMGRIKLETEEAYVLDWPLNMTLILGEDNISRLYVSRYMPYSETNTMLLRKNNVQTITVCNKLYSDYYVQKVQAFNEVDSLDDAEETDTESSEDIDFSALDNYSEESDQEKPSIANIFPLDTSKIN